MPERACFLRLLSAERALSFVNIGTARESRPTRPTESGSACCSGATLCGRFPDREHFFDRAIALVDRNIGVRVAIGV